MLAIGREPLYTFEMQADFHPNTTRGRNSGYALATLTGLLGVALFWLASQTPVGIWQTAVQILSFLLLPFALYLGWQAYQFSTLRYEIEGHNLIVRHGRHLYTYNLRVAQLVLADEYSHVSSFGGLRWPGCFFGAGRAVTTHDETVPAMFFATGPLDQQLLVETADHLLGFSPSDKTAFTQAIAQIQEKEDGTLTAETVLTPPSPILLDRAERRETPLEEEPEPVMAEPAPSVVSRLSPFPVWPAALNGGVWLIVLGRWLIDSTAVLPAPSGLPNQMGHTAVWLVMPFVGLVVFLVNSLLAHRLRPAEPQLAYLLDVTTIIIQVLLFMALIPLFR